MEEKKKKRSKHQPKGLIILHEDKDIIVVDKAPGLLTMGTEREAMETAYFRLTDYVRKGNYKSRERVFIVHRLDREVSGILLFARTPEAKTYLQDQWPDVQKHYLALVHGVPTEAEGVFSSYLVEEGVHKVHSTTSAERGKWSSTAYTALAHARGITLLNIHLLTGRKHQIRVHLSENKLPIVGDQKYGAPKSGARRLALHAKSIAFNHPRDGKPCFFETRVPFLFSQFLEGGRKAPPTPKPGNA
jgi:tRNA pseudouridine32 synthase/23S rRNA pseudouridine746 synthase/23S rRNA pseudouridine1911/1915/1917 synthase